MALRDHLLAQDLIYVGGGSLVNLLAVWEAHELERDPQPRLARRGSSSPARAPARCAGSRPGSPSPRASRSRAPGSGLLSGSLCVHYNNEPERRAAYLDAVGDGMPGGYGLDDYAGLLWEGPGPPSAVTARRGARAYRVAKDEDGVVESPLPARFLPAPAPAALREDIAEFRRISRCAGRWLAGLTP